MKQAAGSRNRRGRTRLAILELLKTLGSTDATTLALRLKVSSMAVRQHLYKLREEGSVICREKAQGVERPEKFWALTHNANRFFPDNHSTFVVKLIEAVEAKCGSKALQKILKNTTGNQISIYRESISKNATLQKKLAHLVELRTAEGFMAEVSSKDSATFLFVENHCPICKAATACNAVCEAELSLFRSILGRQVRLKRTEHILSGDRRCTYQISQI